MEEHDMLIEAYNLLGQMQRLLYAVQFGDREYEHAIASDEPADMDIVWVDMNRVRRLSKNIQEFMRKGV